MPNELVRAVDGNGCYVSVSRAHAESAGLRVLEGRSAFDRNGRTLPAKRRSTIPVAVLRPEQESKSAGNEPSSTDNESEDQ